MKWAALLCLCSCAPVVTVTPSSLPFVRVDESLTGAVVSRDAAIAILSKREQARAECNAKVIGCEARAKVLTSQRDSEIKRADENAWWAIHGPGLFGAGVGVSVIVGVVVGVLFGGLVK